MNAEDRRRAQTIIRYFRGKLRRLSASPKTSAIFKAQIDALLKRTEGWQMIEAPDLEDQQIALDLDDTRSLTFDALHRWHLNKVPYRIRDEEELHRQELAARMLFAEIMRGISGDHGAKKP